MRLVFGVGFNDKKYKTRVDGRKIREYTLWKNMLERCYSKSYQNTSPAYIGCEVSSNFKSFSYFYEWCQGQIGFDCGFELGKNLLVKGNKTYSEDLCLFLPKGLNRVLVKCDAARGDLPVGVCWDNHAGRYKAQIRMFNKKYTLGYFDDPIDAFNAYKVAREKHLKNVAGMYKDKLDPRAYDALMNYTVNIDD